MISHLSDIALSSAIIFLVVLAGLRLLGKRHVAQLSLVDLVLIILVGNTVQNAMVGNDSSLLAAIISVIALLLMNYLMTLVLNRSKKLEEIVEGMPTILVHNGTILRQPLEHEHITEEELYQAMREHGIEQLSEIKSAIMEVDGTISIIPKDARHKTIETFKHQRAKFRAQRPQ